MFSNISLLLNKSIEKYGKMQITLKLPNYSNYNLNSYSYYLTYLAHYNLYYYLCN